MNGTPRRVKAFCGTSPGERGPHLARERVHRVGSSFPLKRAEVRRNPHASCERHVRTSTHRACPRPVSRETAGPRSQQPTRPASAKPHVLVTPDGGATGSCLPGRPRSERRRGPDAKRRYSTGSAKNFRSRRACTRGRTISGCGHLGHTMHVASSGRTGARDKDRESHQGPRRHSARSPKRIAGSGSRTNNPAHNETLSPSDSRSSSSPGFVRPRELRAHHVSLRLDRVRQLLQSGITVLLRDGGAAVAGADRDQRIHVIPCETHGRGIRHQTPRRGLTRRPTRGERDRVT